MVSGFGLAGGDRRKTGEMGADDLGKRNPSGGRGSDRKTAAELEKGASGEIYRRFFVPVQRLVTGTGRPSIQLGAMIGQGISRILDRGKTEERYLMTCGASAGLAAAFHAPLAGVMFAIEEIHKGFSVSILISVMTASVTADFISSYIIGLDPVFAFRLDEFLPQRYYGLLLLLGVIVGVAGVFYNWAMLKVQELYKKPKCLDETGRLLIAFLTAGVLGLCMPEVLGSGHELYRFADRWGNGIENGAFRAGREIRIFGSQFRFRCAGRNFLSAFDIGSDDRRRICDESEHSGSDCRSNISIISFCLRWRDFLRRS